MFIRRPIGLAKCPRAALRCAARLLRGEVPAPSTLPSFRFEGRRAIRNPCACSQNESSGSRSELSATFVALSVTRMSHIRISSRFDARARCSPNEAAMGAAPNAARFMRKAHHNWHSQAHAHGERRSSCDRAHTFSLRLWCLNVRDACRHISCGGACALHGRKAKTIEHV